jgi:hypothetical protein
MINVSNILETKVVGIMDILSKHLRLVTKILSWYPADFQKTSDALENQKIDPTKQRAHFDEVSVKFRNEGNEHFKAGRYPEARLSYTHSLATGIGGPLGALAYSNRFFLRQ